MRVSDALARGAILIAPSWGSFEEAITGIVACLAASGRLPEQLAEAAVQRISEREAVASTAMVDIGVSIPHARLEGVDRLIAAIAVSPRAVYQVGDGLPISIVAVVLSSPSLSGEHLNFLSALSILLQSSRVRERLRRATTAEEVLALVRRNEDARA
jgi:PTS system nitrogen regulatory IIA component